MSFKFKTPIVYYTQRSGLGYDPEMKWLRRERRSAPLLECLRTRLHLASRGIRRKTYPLRFDWWWDPDRR